MKKPMSLSLLFGLGFLFPIGLAEDVRIGAWNIEWLGFPDKRGRPGKDVVQSPESLAKYISESQVDVLALEEIGVDKHSSPWTSQPLDAVMLELKKSTGSEWKYVLFAKADYPDGTEDFVVRGQHTGLAWRTDKASMVGQPFRVPTGKNEAYGIKFWERGANAVKLSFGDKKTDVVFVPIHLKSNRNDVNPDDKQFTEKQRLEEVKVFVDKLADLKKHFQDEDIVVLGDSNFLAPEDGSSELLAKAGLVDLNADDAGTTAAWGTGYTSAPFDRIFVNKKQSEFAKSAQKVHRTKRYVNSRRIFPTIISYRVLLKSEATTTDGSP
jgi:predicted extracellular nuclease